jgi:hypothetical protein
MIPIRVHTVLISTQHNEDVSNEQIHKVRACSSMQMPVQTSLNWWARVRAALPPCRRRQLPVQLSGSCIVRAPSWPVYPCGVLHARRT